MSKAMKIIDKRETQKKKKKRKRTTGTEAIAKGWEINDFCWAFKLGFLQLICKASLIFKSNLELPLLITLKERELYESKHAHPSPPTPTPLDRISEKLISSWQVWEEALTRLCYLEVLFITVSVYKFSNSGQRESQYKGMFS